MEVTGEEHGWEQLVGRVEWSSKSADLGWGGFVELRMLCCISYFPYIPTPAVSILQADGGPAISQIRSPWKPSEGIKLLTSLQSHVVLCWWDTAESLFLLSSQISIFIACVAPQGGKFAVGNFTGFGDACAPPASLECWHRLLLDNCILSVWGGVLADFFYGYVFSGVLCDGFI